MDNTPQDIKRIVPLIKIKKYLKRGRAFRPSSFRERRIMNNKKRLFALITAVLVLALTVAGSLTVSAASEPISTSVAYEFIPQNGQLTAKVTAWDSSCTGLYFTVDGEIVGNNFKVDIVGPVSEYVGTLAYCDKLTTGEHTIGITQVSSLGASYPSSSTTKYYFTSTSSSYVLGGNSVLETPPEELSNVTNLSVSNTLIPRNGCIYTDFEYGGDYYIVTFGNWGAYATPFYVYKYDLSTNKILSTIKIGYRYSYACCLSDVFFYNGFLYLCGVNYRSGSSYDYDYSSSSSFYRIPFSDIASSSDGSTIYLNGNYSTWGSNLPSVYSDEYNRITYCDTDGTYIHMLVKTSSNANYTYYRYSIANSTYETYATDISIINSDYQYENGRAYFRDNNGSYCCFNFSTRELSVVLSLSSSFFDNHLAAFVNVATDYLGNPVGAMHSTVSYTARVGDGKYIFLLSVQSLYYFITSSQRQASYKNYLCYYNSVDNTFSVICSDVPSSSYLHKLKNMLVVEDTRYVFKYTSFAVPRYYTEAEYQAALASGGSSTSAPTAPSLSYRDGKLLWTRTDENNPVYLEYMTYTDYAGSDDNATWTPLVVGMDYTYDYWEIDEYDWNYEKTHYNKWVQFRLVETTDSGDKYSNTIQIDVCLDTHVVDKNNDGYDDSSYTAGYNSGIQSAPKKVGITLSVEKRTIDKVDYIGTVYSFPTGYKVTGWTRTLSFNGEVIQTDTSTQIYDNTNGEATGVTVYYPTTLFTTSGAYTFTVTPTSDSPYLNGNTSTVVYNISVQNGVVTVGSCIQSITVDGTCDKLHMIDTDNDGFDDVSYQNGIAEGFTRGSNNAGAGDLTDLFPKILGSVAGFFISTTGNMTVAGLSVLSIFSVMALGVGIFYLIKVLK